MINLLHVYSCQYLDININYFNETCKDPILEYKNYWRFIIRLLNAVCIFMIMELILIKTFASLPFTLSKYLQNTSKYFQTGKACLYLNCLYLISQKKYIIFIAYTNKSKLIGVYKTFHCKKNKLTWNSWYNRWCLNYISYFHIFRGNDPSFVVSTSYKCNMSRSNMIYNYFKYFLF